MRRLHGTPLRWIGKTFLAPAEKSPVSNQLETARLSLLLICLCFPRNPLPVWFWRYGPPRLENTRFPWVSKAVTGRRKVPRKIPKRYLQTMPSSQSCQHKDWSNGWTKRTSHRNIGGGKKERT